MGHDKVHAGEHVDGTDDIQSATSGFKGLATATQIGKLDGIDPGADVTGANPPQAHDIGGAIHNADTLANLNSKISDLIATYGAIRDIGVGTLAQRPAAGTTGRFYWANDNDLFYYDNGAGWDTVNAEAEAHKDTHDPEDGSDPLDTAAPGSISEAADAEGTSHSFARADHNHQHLATLHEDGGGAEISVAGLSGELADQQPPKNHATNHTDGTDDILDAAVAQKGIVSVGVQEFGGKKTFNDGVDSEADITMVDPGTSADSHKLIMVADNGGTPQTGSMKTAYGADPYVRLSAPNGAGAETAVLDFNDTQVNPSDPGNYDLGTSGAKFKDLYLAGNITVDGTVDGVDVADHSARHENAGADEISVAGLSGVLADDQHIIDAEAITAMGVKGDSNPLNHDRPIQATESVVGIAEIATQAETDTGSDDTRMVTPAKLAAYSGLAPLSKAGSEASGSFTGVPRKATITFSTAFGSTNYSVSVIGGDGRSWSIESKAVGSFVINTGSANALTANVDWIAMLHSNP